MSEDKAVHKRRPRYKGRNPRRFEERYKEQNPEKYAEAVEHIIAKGQTPAGTHRPICVAEILDVLNLKPGEVALDATLGYGGHSQELLAKVSPGGRLFAVDVDPIELPKTEARLRAQGFDDDTLIVRQMNFAGVRSLLYEAGGGFDGILADLGVSSMQIDNPERGFTFKADGPLDLRLNPNRGDSAAVLLKKVSTTDLQRLLTENADEPFARDIAQAIKAHQDPIETTTALAAVVTETLKRARPKPLESATRKSVQRTFMALRITVNEEFSVLDRFLQILPHCLNPGGRVAILSFHSGEDRRVKKAFAYGAQLGTYSKISDAPIRPSAEECRANPRASCAKLRWAVRSDLPLE